MYSPEKLEWVLAAREGFDKHVGDAFHLLIPHGENGYSVNATNEYHYGTKPARKNINQQNTKHDVLPCIVFRALGDECFYLKLGHRDRAGILKIVGRIGDLAIKCSNEGPADPGAFRKFVNKRTAFFLYREKALSGLTSSLSALTALLGFVVNVKDLV